MPEYQVSWTVEIDAETPEQAAQEVARLYFQDRIAEGEQDSACVFKVRSSDKEDWQTVDLVDRVFKLECCHADTCLADYWSGHHLPHIQAAVHNGISLEELKQQLRTELNIGAVMGADYDESDDRWHQAALAAVDAITVNEDADPEHLFKDLEVTEDDDGGEIVWAYFVFREVE